MPTVSTIQNAAIIFLIVFLATAFIKGCREEKLNYREERFKKIGTQYKVTFSTTWNPNNPEAGLRVFFRNPGPSFGGMIGGTHGVNYKFWAPGQYASAGVRHLARSGNTKPLQDEFFYQIELSQAEFIIKGNALELPETEEDESKRFETSTTFSITKEFPLVSLLSRMNPSPDYFVGISGKSLLDADGNFVESLTIPLTLYDAGINKSPFDIKPMTNIPLTPGEPVKPVLIGNQRKYLHHGSYFRFERL